MSDPITEFLRDVFGTRREERPSIVPDNGRLDFAIDSIIGITSNGAASDPRPGISPHEVRCWLRELKELRAAERARQAN